MSELYTSDMVAIGARAGFANRCGGLDDQHQYVRDAWMSDTDATLAAVAPLIAAKALRDAADALAALPSAAVGYGRYDSIGARKGRARQDERGVIGHWLKARADAIARGES